MKYRHQWGWFLTGMTPHSWKLNTGLAIGEGRRSVVQLDDVWVKVFNGSRNHEGFCFTGSQANWWNRSLALKNPEQFFRSVATTTKLYWILLRQLIDHLTPGTSAFCTWHSAHWEQKRGDWWVFWMKDQHTKVDRKTLNGDQEDDRWQKEVEGLGPWSVPTIFDTRRTGQMMMSTQHSSRAVSEPDGPWQFGNTTIGSGNTTIFHGLFC